MDLFTSPEFATHVQALMLEHKVPGLAVAIVENGMRTSCGYGSASLETSSPCTADTLFDIASSSKSLTAASVALLVDDEDHPEVKYEAVMSELLPGDFVLSRQPYTDGVTLEDILSHRSGMPGHDQCYMGPNASRPGNARSVTRNLRNLPLGAPIRSEYHYCNMMYTVATHLIETKSGMSFANFLQQRFFDPLVMSSTCLQPASARSRGFGARIAAGHYWDEEYMEFRVFQTPDCPEAQGAGSIITSANDYIKYVDAIMNRNLPFTDAIYRGLTKIRVSQDSKDVRIDPLTSPSFYCAGWEIFYYRGYTVVGHDGCVPGFGSRHFFMPQLKFGAVIFGNSTSAIKVVEIIARELIDDVVKVPHEERPNWAQIVSRDSNGDDDDNGDDGMSEVDRLRRELCPAHENPQQQQKRSLDDYAGQYWSISYDMLHVQIMNGKLFIDATDRSMGFTMTLEHVHGDAKYIAHMKDALEGSSDPVRAEFTLDNGRVIALGLELEEDIDGLIWFYKEYSGPQQ